MTAPDPRPNAGLGLATRVAPPLRRPGLARALLLVERNVLVYRHTWVVILSGLAEPLLYLGSVGLGIGQLVGDVVVDGRTVGYTEFVAPALLAAAAMNGAVFESTFNIFFKLKYAKVYDAVLATPVGVVDVARGEILWSLLRGGAYAVAFTVVMALFGLIGSWWGLLLVPGAVLIGFAFAAVGMAATTYMRSWTDFDLVTLATLPLFLFSATFYPLDTYPPGLQALVAVTPLYQAVWLLRSLSLGDVGPVLVVPVAYLALMGLGGLRVAQRRLGTLLRT